MLLRAVATILPIPVGLRPWAQTLSPLGVNQQLPRKNVKSAGKNDQSSEKTIATAGRNESVSRGEEDEDCVVQFYYRLMDSNIIGTLFSFYFCGRNRFLRVM